MASDSSVASKSGKTKKEEISLSFNAKRILERRYLHKDEQGNLVETPEELFRRVAKNIASAERLYGAASDVKKAEEEFYRIMTRLDYLPNSPTLMNAGGNLQQLSACFVIPVEDSMESIFEAIKNTALIHKSGGGTGFSFSRIRPKNALVQDTGGVASGPLSFMEVFNAATETVKQGGKRRGANMGILRVDHPDILEFIDAKRDLTKLNNFNLSVALTEKFMKALEADEEYELVAPHTQEVTGKLKAREVFDRIVDRAWSNGDPGIIFIDRMNEYNPTPHVGVYESTNPCVTGDTLVAVADGRDFVPIRQLAEEGEDVPVYCYGEDRIQIRMARNPGLTRRQAEVWKVTLDDGSHIIATPDHKFRHRDFTEVALRDLEPGTALMPFYKYQFEARRDRWQNNYWGINLNNGTVTQEHRLVAEYHLGRPLREDEVVHHRDYNGLNNAWENLEVMTASEHMSFHQKGDRNVMRQKWWDGLSEEERQAYRENMSKACSGEKNGMYGKRHSAETKRKIGATTSARMDAEMRRRLSKSIGQWYAEHGTEFMQGERVERIEVPCGNCGKMLQMTHAEWAFRVAASKSGKVYCSKACVNTTTKTGTGWKPDEVLAWGVRFREETGNLPSVHAWDDYKQQFEPREVPCREVVWKLFGGFMPFKKAVAQYNHKVVSIERYGCEDVYNLTVDDFHTVAYLTSVHGVTHHIGKSLFSGIVSSQCGEQILLPMESCNLGSINLSNMVVDGKVDFEHLARTVKSAVHFLDNVIDVNRFPLPEIEQMTKANRKIGLGVMGFADMLIKLQIPYNSERAVEVAEEVMSFIQQKGREASIELAEKRGAFPNFKGSVFDTAASASEPGAKPMRNATVTTIAPTGTISIIADCSSGIEPNFAWKTTRRDSFGEVELLHPLYEEWLQAHPDEALPDYFVTAHEVTPEWHVRIQAAFQKYTDNAVSKTLNFPNSATRDDVREAYILAYKLGCKGVTIYRDGSRDVQVLSVSQQSAEKARPERSRKEKEGTKETTKKERKDAVLREPRPRPQITMGKTIKMKTGCGNLYVTINEDEEGLCEVFSTMGKAGGCTASQSEAISRLISTALRSGISVDSIVEQLSGISCPLPVWQNGVHILSCADAIGKAIQFYLDEKNGGNRIHQMRASEGEEMPGRRPGGTCPECGGVTEYVEGCVVCRSCGFSRCE